MDFNDTNVIFLEMKDYKGKTLTINGKPFPGTVLVMVQGSFCGYCTKSKPDFIRIARDLGSNKLDDNGVYFATIKIDGEKDEQKLGKAISDLTGEKLPGVPAYLVYKNGTFVGLHTGGRDSNSLKNAIGM